MIGQQTLGLRTRRALRALIGSSAVVVPLGRPAIARLRRLAKGRGLGESGEDFARLLLVLCLRHYEAEQRAIDAEAEAERVAKRRRGGTRLHADSTYHYDGADTASMIRSDDGGFITP